ncbi:MAG: phosphoesterase [Clostridiales bacterium]|nr:phosphoesterase [Clostridiales bacterium]
MLDIHCHMLPQVDDGAENEEQSLQMLHAAKEAGIDRIVVTPHMRSVRTDISHIKERFTWLKKKAKKDEIHVLLGFEVNVRVLPDLGIERIREFCMEESSLLLLEFQDDRFPTSCRQMLYQLERENIQVIIAHPERYQAIQKDLSNADMLLEMGCRLQLDAGSLFRPIWSAEHRTALKLLQQRKVSFLASDAHSPDDYRFFKKAVENRKWMELLTDADWERELVFQK